MDSFEWILNQKVTKEVLEDLDKSLHDGWKLCNTKNLEFSCGHLLHKNSNPDHHLDYHFRKIKQVRAAKEKGAKPLSRGWYVEENEYVSHTTDHSSTPLVIATPQFTFSSSSSSSSPPVEKEQEDKNEFKMVADIVAPSVTPACGLCKETIESKFKMSKEYDGDGDYFLCDAIEISPSVFYHFSCFTDMMIPHHTCELCKRRIQYGPSSDKKDQNWIPLDSVELQTCFLLAPSSDKKVVTPSTSSSFWVHSNCLYKK